MNMTTCLLASLIATVPGFCQTLTQGERDRALSELYATRKVFLDSVAGLTEAQWNFKPAPDVWSIAECAEHITLSEDLIAGRARQMMESPAEPDKRALTKGKDEAILKGAADRSQKFKAPEVLVPTHRWPTQAALVAHFKESRDRTLDYVRTTEDPLRVHFSDHPVFKTLDAYQWFLLLSAHTARHTAQLNEVKQNPNYPK
jgi:hypothetical protein